MRYRIDWHTVAPYTREWDVVDTVTGETVAEGYRSRLSAEAHVQRLLAEGKDSPHVDLPDSVRDHTTRDG